MRDNQSVFRYRIRQATRKIVQPAPVVMRALVGKGDGSTVDVSGMSRYIWVRVNGVRMAVYNNRVTAVYDLPVLVGYDEINPQLLQVLGFDYGAQSDSFPAGFSVPLHGETHRIFSPTGGNDIVWVELRQFLPLSVTASGMDVNIYPGNVPIGNSWVYLAATAVDLTTYVPLTGQCYALIYIDSAGAVQVTAGTPTASPLNLADIPVLPDASYAICAVHMYAGQTTVRDSVAATDIIDLRFPGRTSHDLVTLDSDAGVILDISGQQIGLDTQTANTVLAGPATGAANEPTFRALVAGDVGTGTPDNTKYLRDDMSWQVVTSHDAVTLDADAGGILDLQGAGGQEIGLDVQAANTVLAGPVSGAANEPTFRALSLANGDIDDVDVAGDGQGDILYHNSGTYEDYPLGIGIAFANEDGRIKIGDVVVGDYIEINNTSGEVTLIGGATAFKDLEGALIGKKLDSPASHITEDVDEGALVFDDSCTLTDHVTINHQINHEFVVGGDAYPHIHWWQTSSDVPNWLIAYRWQVQGAERTDTWTNLAWDHHIFTYNGETALNQITDFPVIPAPDGAGLSDVLQIKLYRDTGNDSDEFDGLDPLAGDVSATSLDCHLEVDSFGSYTEYTKNRIEFRLTESGDFRLTESGDKRVIE